MSSLLLGGIVTSLFLVGLVGIFIPFLPGIAFVFAGVLVYALATDFTSISPVTVIVMGVVALLAWLADYYGSALGARWGGGKIYAMIGSIVGALAGALIAGPPALLIGAFLGALAGALIEGNSPLHAGRIAILSLIGTIGATIVQFMLGVSIIAAFLLALAI